MADMQGPSSGKGSPQTLPWETPGLSQFCCTPDVPTPAPGAVGTMEFSVFPTAPSTPNYLSNDLPFFFF